MSRQDELRARLDRVRERIHRACSAAGRDPTELTLVVVTKTFPVDDVRTLVALDVRDVGENRQQEAVEKAAACADLDLRWHFVGQLQTNKAADVAGFAEVVHSVDRPRLVNALDRGGDRHGRVLHCLIQVRLDDGPGRGGVRPDGVAELADRIAGSAHLVPAGVMAIAPLGADPRPAFTRLAQVAERLRRTHPAASWVSAGMSDDLEEAIACGATHLRVGRAVLGDRPPAR